MDEQMLNWLTQIRAAELQEILSIVGGFDGKVLEIGGGTGWQAAELHRLGVDITSIELQNSNYSSARIFPLIDYDGKRIPFSDGLFDIIFSSNVLEHVPHLVEFQIEMMRVLKPGGRAIHVMPSHSWRMWSNVAHYASLLAKIFARASGSADRTRSSTTTLHNMRSNGRMKKLKNILIPALHGERGNIITEAFYFSPSWWTKQFKLAGWKVEKVAAVPLFYSGYMVIKSAINIQQRKRLAGLLGAASTCFVLSKPQNDSSYRGEILPK